MKRNTHSAQSGSALIVALLVIFIIAGAIGAAMTLTTATVRSTDSSRDYSALREATEGALDFGYGIWTKTINSYYSPATAAQLNAGLATKPSFSGFSYASTSDGPLTVQPVDAYGQPVASGTPPPSSVNLDKYPGWTGKNFSYLASVRMTGTLPGNRNVTYGAKRSINYAVVPLFQATAFFEGDLELYRTATMTIGGLVHTNGTAYVSQPSNNVLTFTGNLSYSTNYIDGQWKDSNGVTRDAPPQAWNWSGYAPGASKTPTFSGNGGFNSQVNGVDRMEPLGTDSNAIVDTTDTNPNNDSMRELIEPPNDAFPDPTPIAERRLYNKAGIVIHMTTSISKGQTVVTPTITAQNGTTLNNGQINNLQKALSQQTFYDRREGKYVDVTSLDVQKAKSVFDGAKNFNSILYIDQTNTNGTISTSNPQGIRLVNGNNLPKDGLTVASQNPVYIQGDYNTQGQQPSSAVFADAVTILSNNWNDSNSASSLSSRNASDTEVNTAIVSGNVPSGWKNPDTGATYGYSGGLNNFPRFLENWTNDTFTYNGSMISLFTSQIATGEWDTGNIYSPPNRVWNFDSKFADNPPPGSLDAVTIGRGALARF